MKYGSVCSGIEAATVAWHPLGWKPVFFAEIEKFPSSVLNHHYPAVPNAGDFTAIQDGHYDPIELLVGGTPCQDFSVAGLRAGMDGVRGQLTVEFAHLAGRLRPRWLVWENVPGVLSIDGGRAFGTFLGLLGQLGYGIAYRILDAQHFGVPQRRRRVFVVGHLGDWRRGAAVLFERHSLGPSFGKGFGAWEEVAGVGNQGVCCGIDGELNAREQLSGCLNTTSPSGGGTPAMVAINLRGREGGANPEPDRLASLRAASGGSSRSYVTDGVAVRRLTPRECERLQEFPDDYTRISDKTPDGHRYRALGNSMAVPVMAWIGKRIQAVEK